MRLTWRDEEGAIVFIINGLYTGLKGQCRIQEYDCGGQVGGAAGVIHRGMERHLTFVV